MDLFANKAEEGRPHKKNVKQAQLGVPHSEIQVELD